MSEANISGGGAVTPSISGSGGVAPRHSDRDDPLGAFEWIMGLLGMAAGIIGVAPTSLLGGCRSFYDNAGVHVRTGSLTAPIEVSEPTSSINIRALYTMDGIDLYAAKDCQVRMVYTNDYTNSYFGIVETRGTQSSEVRVKPTEGETPAP